jgi:myo-inositol-1(or 4)-monophosphatase
MPPQYDDTLSALRLPDRDDVAEVARRAGELSLRFFRGELDVTEKPDDAGLVTQADVACEELVKAWIAGRFPEHRVLGEESGWTLPAGESRSETTSPTAVWIIDPIDGTTNFSNGNPYYCVSVACAVLQPDGAATVIAGAICHPHTGDLYTAVRGRGTRCNDVPVRVNSNVAFGRASFCTGFSSLKGEALDPVSRAMVSIQSRSVGLRINGAAALDLAYVSRGISHGFFETSLKPWDLAAGSLLVSEAGGKVTNLAGAPFDVLRHSDILCANPSLHAELLLELHTGPL